MSTRRAGGALESLIPGLSKLWAVCGMAQSGGGGEYCGVWDGTGQKGTGRLLPDIIRDDSLGRKGGSGRLDGVWDTYRGT